eukprot:1003207-Pleurochrysis_carterae.AAC.3
MGTWKQANQMQSRFVDIKHQWCVCRGTYGTYTKHRLSTVMRGCKRAFGFQYPPCSDPSNRSARNIHNDVAQRKQLTRSERLCEETREAICAAHKENG